MIDQQVEKYIFGDISKGVQSPQEHYTVVGRYFHDMHANAHYDVNGANPNFHPIVACTKASVMALSLVLFGKFITGFAPLNFRNEFRLIVQGAPLVYAASIIYTAAQGWSAATNGNTTESCS